MTDTDEPRIDLVVDLNGEDESGLPWTFRDEARDQALVVEGAWLVVGQGTVRAVAQVVEIEGEIVRDAEERRRPGNGGWPGVHRLTAPVRRPSP